MACLLFFVWGCRQNSSGLFYISFLNFSKHTTSSLFSLYFPPKRQIKTLTISVWQLLRRPEEGWSPRTTLKERRRNKRPDSCQCVPLSVRRCWGVKYVNSISNNTNWLLPHFPTWPEHSIFSSKKDWITEAAGTKMRNILVSTWRTVVNPIKILTLSLVLLNFSQEDH